MKYLVISFKSRTSTMEFSKILNSRGINSKIINTPSSIGSSCMLSIQTIPVHYQQVISLIKLVHLQGFLGIYLIEKQGLRQQTQRLY